MLDQEGQVAVKARHSELEAVGKSFHRLLRKQEASIVPLRMCSLQSASSIRMGNTAGESGLLVPIPASRDRSWFFLCLSNSNSVVVYTSNTNTQETGRTLITYKTKNFRNPS